MKGPEMVTHTCHPQEVQVGGLSSSKPWAKTWELIWKITEQKGMGPSSSCRMLWGPEFNPQCHQKVFKKSMKSNCDVRRREHWDCSAMKIQSCKEDSFEACSLKINGAYWIFNWISEIRSLRYRSLRFSMSVYVEQFVQIWNITTIKWIFTQSKHLHALRWGHKESFSRIFTFPYTLL
jgi:hypothetical protein